MADETRDKQRRSTGQERRRSPASHEDVARRAYERFEARGAGHGDDQEDWFAAERDLRATDEPSDAEMRPADTPEERGEHGGQEESSPRRRAPQRKRPGRFAEG